MDSLLQKHPLQRLDSPSRSVSLIVHILGLTSFSYGFWFLRQFPSEMSEAYGWHFQYLTIIGLALSTVTFVFGILADVLSNRTLFTIKNAFAVSSAPLETLISLLYWGLVTFDRSLVIPPEMALPLLPDLNFHLFPSLLLLTDILFLSPPWTFSVLPALATPSALACAYWFWLEHCYVRNSFYPYPMMNAMSERERMGLFAASALTMAASTLALKRVYGLFNGNMPKGVPGDVKGKRA